MKIVDSVALALTAYVGKALTSKQIVAVTINKFPELEARKSSILPSDYAGANPKSGVVYADQILQRQANGTFLVLPADKRINKPSTRGARGESMESALKSAEALLTPAKPTPAQATPTPAQAAGKDVKTEVKAAIQGQTNEPVKK